MSPISHIISMDRDEDGGKGKTYGTKQTSPTSYYHTTSTHREQKHLYILSIVASVSPVSGYSSLHSHSHTFATNNKIEQHHNIIIIIIITRQPMCFVYISYFLNVQVSSSVALSVCNRRPQHSFRKYNTNGHGNVITINAITTNQPPSSDTAPYNNNKWFPWQLHHHRWWMLNGMFYLLSCRPFFSFMCPIVT